MKAKLKSIFTTFVILLLVGMGITGALKASDTFSNIIGVVAIICLFIWAGIEIWEYKLPKDSENE
jgi:threonine/homoserine/homoserine lactone efflux protein